MRLTWTPPSQARGNLIRALTTTPHIRSCLHTSQECSPTSKSRAEAACPQPEQHARGGTRVGYSRGSHGSLWRVGTMEGSIGKDEIVATTKFKPSSSSIAARQKKQQDDVVDDWDAESSDEDTASVQQNDAAETSPAQADVFRASKDEWTEA